jgi:hypothetical protein
LSNYHLYCLEIAYNRESGDIHIENDHGMMAQDIRQASPRTERVKAGDGFRPMVPLRKQARALKILKGLGWEGDLDEMRGRQPSALFVMLAGSKRRKLDGYRGLTVRLCVARPIKPRSS